MAILFQTLINVLIEIRVIFNMFKVTKKRAKNVASIKTVYKGDCYSKGQINKLDESVNTHIW